MRIMRGSGGRPSSPGLTLVDCRSGFERLNGDTAASMVGAACGVKAGSGMCCTARASLGINASPIYCRRHSPKSVAGLSESSVPCDAAGLVPFVAPANPGLAQAGSGDIENPFAVECVLEAYGTPESRYMSTNAGTVRRSEGHSIAPFAVYCPVLARKRARRSGQRPCAPASVSVQPMHHRDRWHTLTTAPASLESRQRSAV